MITQIQRQFYHAFKDMNRREVQTRGLGLGDENRYAKFIFLEMKLEAHASHQLIEVDLGSVC